MNLIRTYTLHSYAVFALEYTIVNTVISGDLGGYIKIWSMSTGVTVKSQNFVGVAIISLELLNNGYYLAIGFDTGNIYIYNINTYIVEIVLTGHQTYVYDLAAINSNLIASASGDKSVRLWNLTTGIEKFIFLGHTNEAISLKVVSTEILASGSGDNTTKLWNLTSGSLIRTLTGHASYIRYSLDLLSDGNTLVSGSIDQTFKLWSISTGECLNTINTNLQIRVLAAVFNITLSKIIFLIYKY